MSAKAPALPKLNKIITVLNKTDGRDKFGKSIQGLSKYLHWYYMNKNKDLAARMSGLSAGMASARKLFRLFKSMNEIEKVIDLTRQDSNGDEATKYLTILQRLLFAGYFFFDNMVILIGVKFLKSNKDKASKYSNTFWFFALALGVLLGLKKIVENYTKIASLKKQLLLNKEQNTADLDKIAALEKNNVRQGLSILAQVGDMMAAGTGSKIYANVLGKEPNTGLIGLGGMTSGLVGGYFLF